MKIQEAVVTAVMAARQNDDFITAREPHLTIELGGVPGDRHFGLLRPADSRQRIYPRGTMIANRRQISIVSEEDCERIASALGIGQVLPEWLGANMLLRGYESLTMLPQGARLVFPDGTGLICEGENLPCTGPGKVIAMATGKPEVAAAFVKAAKQLRGIVCSVEREGSVHAGDAVKIYT